jgi:hypothetical protein
MNKLKIAWLAFLVNWGQSQQVLQALYLAQAAALAMLAWSLSKG